MDSDTYKILLVDDNADIHDDFKKILITDRNAKDEESLREIKSQLFGEESQAQVHLNYEIDSAYQGEEAIELVAKAFKENKPYALAFMDVLMPPGFDGIETTKRLWEIDPDIQIVICTAYADYSWNDIIKKLGVNDNFIILKKPFESIEIRQFACCLTRKWHLSQQAGHKYDRLYEEVVREADKLKKMLEKNVPKK
jgi:CheY-like chemotaxis protein